MTDPVASIQSALADRYAIERELGRGGMATVYPARDLRHERFVALKVLRPDLAAALGPERFTREIKVAPGLQHPHIISVHDSGTTPDAAPTSVSVVETAPTSGPQYALTCTSVSARQNTTAFPEVRCHAVGWSS